MKHRYESDRMLFIARVVMIISLLIAIAVCLLFLHEINHFIGVQEGFDTDLLVVALFIGAYYLSKSVIEFCIVVYHAMKIRNKLGI